MKPQNQPTEIAGFAEFGTGRTNWSHSCNMESNRRDVSPAIELELGLELELGTGYSKRSCGFTIFQLQELQLQSLIYKYMEAGLAVPRQLVIPIWKSVASSVAGFNSGLQQLYPSFFGSGSVHLELRNGIDPEPGRCRRTDGKKWRCSKEAIPDHKYCERHVHRGRLRSRKLVEASGPNYSITSPTTNTNANANTNLSISPPTVSSTGSGSNPSPNFGFSPRSVLHGGNKRT